MNLIFQFAVELKHHLLVIILLIAGLISDFKVHSKSGRKWSESEIELKIIQKVCPSA